MANSLAASILMLVGAAFLFLASLGVSRMPDLFSRLQTTTKAATLGVGCVLLAAAIHFGELGVTARALAVIVFVLLTAPVAAHMIGRAAYLSGVRLWEGTIVDELRGRYDPRSHALGSAPREDRGVPAAEDG